MAAKKATASTVEAAEKAALEDKHETYELGGIKWNVTLPIPGLLTLKLGEAAESGKGQNAIFLKIMYAAINDEEHEDFDNRMVARPTVSSEDIVEFISWIIEESTATPLEEF